MSPTQQRPFQVRPTFDCLIVFMPPSFPAPTSALKVRVAGSGVGSSRGKVVLKVSPRGRILLWSNLGAFTGFFPGFHLQSDSPDDAGCLGKPPGIVWSDGSKAVGLIPAMT
jgi:hypothetical protein